MSRSMRDTSSVKASSQRRDPRGARHGTDGHNWTLAADHPAAVEGRTRYPRSLMLKTWPPLKSGFNNTKIGRIVTKGAWTGFPIYTLTLEERATCPRSCAHWLDCYGNKMPFSSRQTAGPQLEGEIEDQIRSLSREYPRGFVIRLHVLGDFYSPEYVRLWAKWLTKFPALHTYGYTAWGSKTKIGAAIDKLTVNPRFRIRRSEGEGLDTTITVDTAALAPAHAIVCPAQTGKSECCATSALCWATTKQIAFVRH